MAGGGKHSHISDTIDTKLRRRRVTSKTKSEKILRLINANKKLTTNHAYTILGQSSIITNQGIPQFQKSTSLKIRMKNLQCRVAQAHFAPQPVACSHCPGNKTETQGHILGGCGHPTMKSMICKQHGKAVYLIATAIRNGLLGQTAFFMDAETEEHSLPNLPQWFPRAPNGVRNKPDIVVLPGVFNTSITTSHTTRRQETRLLRRILILR